MADHGTCPTCNGIYQLDGGRLVLHTNRGSLTCAGSEKPPTKAAVFERCGQCWRGDWKLYPLEPHDGGQDG